MIVQYCSDLHLEFKENSDFLKTNPLLCKGDILILAGDIIPFAVMDQHQDFFDYISDQFPITYWIPGNHEYYFSDISLRSGSFLEEVRPNVFLANNVVVSHNSQDFILSSLWSQLNVHNSWHMEQAISDFQVIRHENSHFTAPAYNDLHNCCLSFVTKELIKNESRRAIVVTHHAPTFLAVPQQCQLHAYPELYAVELSALIQSFPVPFWIYGHHHCNLADFVLGKTSLVTNQLGYFKDGLHQTFRQNKTIVIDT